MPSKTPNSESKVVPLKARLALIITGIVFFCLLVGLIIWSSIMLARLPETYSLNSPEYHQALTFGIMNGFSDFIGLILLVNICVYSYSTKIFKTVSDYNKDKKEQKKLLHHENLPSHDSNLSEGTESDLINNVVK